jgi:hypothetical protein
MTSQVDVLHGELPEYGRKVDPYFPHRFDDVRVHLRRRPCSRRAGLLDQALEERLGHLGAARVPDADEQDVCHLGLLERRWQA